MAPLVVDMIVAATVDTFGRLADVGAVGIVLALVLMLGVPWARSVVDDYRDQRDQAQAEVRKLQEARLDDQRRYSEAMTERVMPVLRRAIDALERLDRV